VIGHTHRTSIIKHLGISPFQICFGIQPNLAVDCTLQPNLANLPTSVKTYFQAMEPQLKLMSETVRENRSHVLPKDKHSHKCIPRWTGPYLVIQIFPDYNVYRIQHCQTLKICPSLINADRLRLCVTGRDRYYCNMQNVAADADSESDRLIPASEQYFGATDRPILQQEADQQQTDGIAQQQLPTADQSIHRARRLDGRNTATPAAPTQWAERSRSKPAVAAPLPLSMNGQSRSLQGDSTASMNRSTHSQGNGQPVTQLLDNNNTVQLDGAVSQDVTSTPTVADADNNEQWCDIKKIAAHQKRGAIVYYKVLWSTRGTSWVKDQDVSDYAKDCYWTMK